MNVIKALQNIQQELKAPKGQYNSFGKYNYRSCEDILEAVKPLLLKNDAVLALSDEVVLIGDRIYVKATAELSAVQGTEITTKTVTAYAREDESKKGMDGSQITGTASSYARKYALNGLFCIDDTKDADTPEQRTEQTARAAASAAKTQRNAETAAKIAQETANSLSDAKMATDQQKGKITALMKSKCVTWAEISARYHIRKANDMTYEMAEDCISSLNNTVART